MFKSKKLESSYKEEVHGEVQKILEENQGNVFSSFSKILLKKVKVLLEVVGRVSFDKLMKKGIQINKLSLVKLITGMSISDPKEVEYQIGKEFIELKRVSDVILKVFEDNKEFLEIHVEFEKRFKSWKNINDRMLAYRLLEEIDSNFNEKNIINTVFFLDGPKIEVDKYGKKVSLKKEEEIIIQYPENNDNKKNFSVCLKYKIYRAYLYEFKEDIKEKNLFMFLPFIAIEEYEKHRVDIAEYIDQLKSEESEYLRNTIAYYDEKYYDTEVKGNLIDMMDQHFFLREADIRRGVEQGLEQGLEQKAINTVINCFNEGVTDFKKISRISELTEKQVKGILIENSLITQEDDSH